MPNNQSNIQGYQSNQYNLHVSTVSAILFVIILIIGGLIGLGVLSLSVTLAVVIWTISFFCGWFLSSALKIASQWERAVVLRLGNFTGLKGPGVFFIIPFIDTIPYWIDVRTLASEFRAEQTLTKDNVPVDVDAIMFWKVVDSKKAALDVADYKLSVSLAAQTALRDTIGQTELSQMLAGRQSIDDVLKDIIDKRTSPWGVEVISVEIKDVIIPANLQNAMSLQAQAERERQARVILGDSERQIAESFSEAAKQYENNPTALHLRAMNMLYEGLKEKGALVIVPSTAAESMNLGSVAAYSTLNEQLRGGKHSNVE